MSEPPGRRRPVLVGAVPKRLALDELQQEPVAGRGFVPACAVELGGSELRMLEEFLVDASLALASVRGGVLREPGPAVILDEDLDRVAGRELGGHDLDRVRRRPRKRAAADRGEGRSAAAR